MQKNNEAADIPSNYIVSSCYHTQDAITRIMDHSTLALALTFFTAIVCHVYSEEMNHVFHLKSLSPCTLFDFMINSRDHILQLSHFLYTGNFSENISANAFVCERKENGRTGVTGGRPHGPSSL
nr:antho-RFamide neuropeptides-like isoform X2 [Biomphalaria glabrata]